MVNKNIVKIVELACELEDIESLIPEELENEVMKLKNMAVKQLKLLPGKESQIKYT